MPVADSVPGVAGRQDRSQAAIDYALAKLRWMRAERIWPNGLRYLWTDAFGVVLYVSLFRALHDEAWLDEAEGLVAEVDRVLGRPRGIRIGEAPDRDGQYFHYLSMWLFALARLGEHRPGYRQRGIELARTAHPAFVVPGVGVHWKMLEDLSAPYPGYGFGALDAYDGYIAYRLLDPVALAPQMAEMATLIDRSCEALRITQDLGLGMMLWLCHFAPGEHWAKIQRPRCLETLERMWIDPPGYYCREPFAPAVRFAFTNYGVSLGLQSVGSGPERVARLHRYFESYHSGDEYDREAITWVMACAAHLPGAFLQPHSARR